MQWVAVGFAAAAIVAPWILVWYRGRVADAEKQAMVSGFERDAERARREDAEFDLGVADQELVELRAQLEATRKLVPRDRAAELLNLSVLPSQRPRRGAGADPAAALPAVPAAGTAGAARPPGER